MHNNLSNGKVRWQFAGLFSFLHYIINVMAYVYLLCDSGCDHVFKIGVTRGSIEKRIKKLQTGNGNEIFMSSYHETDRPFLVESMLHQWHYPDKKKGEWFNLSSYGPLDFNRECVEIETILDGMKGNPFMRGL